MPLSAQDALYLTRALHLARDTAAFASPNPAVGCALALHGEVVAEGAHRYEARDHAEVAALKQAASLGHNVQGATAYVTLEPCAHHGRTGPCADALVAAGIARCVVATVDPNPLVRGAGLEKLRAADMEVLLLDPADALAEQSRRLNDAFAHFIQQRRPFVTLKAALSVDGMIAPPSSARVGVAPHWITGSAARADAQGLRHSADAIITGIGTVLADNPTLTDRTGLARRRPLLRVILDSNLRLPLDSTLVRSACGDVLVVCKDNAPAAKEAALRDAGVAVHRAASQAASPQGQGSTAAAPSLDLGEVLSLLADRQIVSVLVEAGSALNAALLRANLVDKVVLYYAEAELGAGAVPFAAGYGSPYVLQQRLTQMTRTSFASNVLPNAHAEDVRIGGYLHDPWADLMSHP